MDTSFKSDFVFACNLHRAITTLEKYCLDEPCYYEFRIDMGCSIIAKKDNKESNAKWLFVDYTANNTKNSFINGYKQISL